MKLNWRAEFKFLETPSLDPGDLVCSRAPKVLSVPAQTVLTIRTFDPIRIYIDNWALQALHMRIFSYGENLSYTTVGTDEQAVRQIDLQTDATGRRYGTFGELTPHRRLGEIKIV
jgi:hypothetical protein